jgi:hypothetical protein
VRHVLQNFGQRQKLKNVQQPDYCFEFVLWQQTAFVFDLLCHRQTALAVAEEVAQTGVSHLLQAW